MDPKVVVNGKEYSFVTEGDLTLGEAAEIEEICGQGYDLAQIGARGLLALTYISVRRVDGSVRLDDLKALKADDIDVRVPEPPEPVPPPSAADSTENGGTGNESSPASSGGSPEETPAITGSPV